MKKLWPIIAAAFCILSLCGFFFFGSKDEPKIVFETDSRKTLGTQLSSVPELALPFLKKEELALRLGFRTADELSVEVGVLAERINAGYLPNDWEERCTAYTNSLCTVLDDYFMISPLFIEKPPRRSRKRPVPFQKKNISKLQGEELNEIFGRAPDWSIGQIQSLSKDALRHSECPRSLSLTLARKLELHADKKNAWDLLDKLETHGLECLTPENPHMEYQWLRRGLIMLARDRVPESLKAFEQAYSAEKKREESRILYWLIGIYEKEGRKEEAQKLSERLFTAFPLSWFTILTKIERGLDPTASLREKKPYTDVYAGSQTFDEKKILWLQALIAEKRFNFAASKFGDYVVRTLSPTTEAGAIQHLARLFDEVALYRLQIVSLNMLLQQRPETVTAETLRLLYPKPFFEDIDKQSARLDSALILGLARQESSFDPFARSNANAQGLLQILPSTARDLSKKKAKKDHLYNYAQNIELGSRFVMRLIKLFDGSAEKALAAYNAGQGTVRKWENRYGFTKNTQLFLDLIPYRETREYVPSILRNAYWYHRLFPGFSENLKDSVMTSALLRQQLMPAKTL